MWLLTRKEVHAEFKQMERSQLYSAQKDAQNHTESVLHLPDGWAMLRVGRETRTPILLVGAQTGVPWVGGGSWENHPRLAPLPSHL